LKFVAPQGRHVALMEMKFGMKEWTGGRVSLARFSRICRFCIMLQDALAVKIWMGLFKGLRSFGGFKFRATVSPKFSAPLATKLSIEP